MRAAADGLGGRIARWEVADGGRWAAVVSSRIQQMLEPRYEVYIQQKCMRTKKYINIVIYKNITHGRLSIPYTVFLMIGTRKYRLISQKI